MKFFQGTVYQHIPLDEERLTSFNKEEVPFDNEETTASSNSRLWNHITIARPRSTHLTFLVCLVTLVALFWLASGIIRPPTLKTCLKQTEAYSPAFEAVELYDTNFVNAFNQRNKYIGPPTPEREEAWVKLWDQAEVLIPSEEMEKLNVSGDMLGEYMKAPVDEGHGYVGGLEVFHQIHCLNYVRQFTWYLMDKYTEETMPPGFKNPLKVLRMHTDHCIETLRLALMCHSDVTPVLVKMDRYYDPPRPQAEFSSYHRCRNFEKIVEWNEENGLSTFGNVNAHTNHGHD
ncbi:hypothetical protein G7Y89_g9576 [Cudoniella acicularis]|uniref:Tat pathway signal sequence n=1 Tax=Cudoniella acicularis TaxID=354080 RepID=A0A8H4VZZ4_9HELO|nr:hypothetical protein G7Y89_g9576 [Cudoniella acicularis]